MHAVTCSYIGLGLHILRVPLIFDCYSDHVVYLRILGLYCLA